MKNKKVLITFGIILAMIIIGGFFFTIKGEKIEPSHEASHENIKMEREIRGIIEEVIDEQRQEGIEITIDRLETYNERQGFVKLGCENLDYDVEEKIMGDISAKLLEKYSEDYGENGDLWFDIQTCSQSGSSPDGINTYYSPTEWMFSNGEYGMRI
ncbi:hypothetical protein HOD29_05695 [archaeon]|jgi:hypothetical protein|nr:hypothetical protein [archaeon]